MKNIILILSLITSLLQSDTVGLPGKVWNGVSTEIYNETEPLTSIENEVKENITSNGWLEDATESSIVENEIVTPTQTLPDAVIMTNEPIDPIQNEIVIPSQNIPTPIIESTLAQDNTPTIIDTQPNEELVIAEPTNLDATDEIELSGKAEIIENSLNIKQQTEKILDFLSPLWTFAQENILLSALFLTVLGLIFYLLFKSPSASIEVDKFDFDDEFEIPQAIMPRGSVDNSIIPDKNSIISQSQYSTLYGLINETFISEKERVMLASDITQERKNRELISLEWKFNQILHFSLPKLSSNNSYHFSEGVTELLDEDLTKDILVIALKDILKLKSIKEEDKMQIVKKLKNLELKKEFA